MNINKSRESQITWIEIRCQANLFSNCFFFFFTLPYPRVKKPELSNYYSNLKKERERVTKSSSNGGKVRLSAPRTAIRIIKGRAWAPFHMIVNGGPQNAQPITNGILINFVQRTAQYFFFYFQWFMVIVF